MTPPEVHLKVRQIFEVAVYEWASEQTPEIPVSFENAQIAPETAKYLLQVMAVPTITRSRTLAGTDHTQCSGVIQVNVLVPLMEGVAKASEIASALSEMFPTYSRIPEITPEGVTPRFHVQVVSPVEIMPGLQTNTKYTVPISLRYRVDI